MEKNYEKTISIIVPVYNAAEYIQECLESICKQSYDNLEILVLNDGSTDNSLEIVEAVASNDKRIKVFSNCNKGLSATRNFGIIQSSGEYIAFVDADDIIHKDYILTLYEICRINNTSISQCNYLRFGKARYEKLFTEVNDDVIETGINDVKVYDSRQMQLNLYNRLMLPSTLSWTKLYKRELFNVTEDTLNIFDIENIAFPEGRIHEDDFTSFRLFYKAGKIAVSEIPLYGYRRTPKSITNDRYSVARLDLISSLEGRMKFYLEVVNDRKLYRLAIRRYFYELCRAITKIRNEKEFLEKDNYLDELKRKRIKSLHRIFLIPKFEDKSFIRTQLIKVKCTLYYILGENRFKLFDKSIR